MIPASINTLLNAIEFGRKLRAQLAHEEASGVLGVTMIDVAAANVTVTVAEDAIAADCPAGQVLPVWRKRMLVAARAVRSNVASTV